MSRVSVVGDAGEALSQATEALLFRPTEAQVRLKSKWLVRIQDNPAIDAQHASRSDIERVLGTSLGKSWDDPAFREWFLNSSEHREKMEELAELAHAAARNLLLNEEPKVQGARAQLIKFMLEYKSPKKSGSGQFLDKAIASMDSAQLSLYLERNGVALNATATKNIAPSSASPQTLDIESEETP